MTIERIWTITLVLVSLVGCKTLSDSQSKIINGKIEESKMRSSVVYLEIDLERCTGVLVQKDLVLTAAHCIQPEGYRYSELTLRHAPGENTSLTPVRFFIPDENRKIFYHPLDNYPDPSMLGTTTADGGGLYDIAFIQIEETTVGVPLTVVSESDERPKKGDPVTLYGFGKTGPSFDNERCNPTIEEAAHDRGLLQVGSNVVVNYVEHEEKSIGDKSNMHEFIILSACDRETGENSIPSSGDSGGPLVINNKVAGVASLGGADLASYSSLHSPYFQEYFKKVKGEILKFSDYCKANNDSGTVKALLKLAEETDCARAEEKLLNLEEIDLSNKGIDDIRPLMGFAKLSSLNLSGNNISDITPFSPWGTLPKLRSLNISNNQITDVSALDFKKSLRKLNLSQNNIENLRYIKDLNKMELLSVSGNPIGTSIKANKDNCLLEGNRVNQPLLEWCKSKI